MPSKSNKKKRGTTVKIPVEKPASPDKSIENELKESVDVAVGPDESLQLQDIVPSEPIAHEIVSTPLEKSNDTKDLKESVDVAVGPDESFQVIIPSEPKPSETVSTPLEKSDDAKAVNAVELEGSSLEVIRNLPDGKYKIVSLALDLTGRTTADEIFQIAAHAHPNNTFAHYVMPYRNIRPSARRIHGVQITEYGLWRFLRNVDTKKVLKTRSTFSALNEFYDWLKEVKGDTDGIVFLYHDHKWANIPFFLKKAMREFNMENKFEELIKGYINCAKIIREREDLEFAHLEFWSLNEKDKKKKALHSVSLSALVRSESVSKEKWSKLSVELQTARRRAELTKKLFSKMFDFDFDCEDEGLLAGLKNVLHIA